jgi:P4 family phage/plasmid primase-like protien
MSDARQNVYPNSASSVRPTGAYDWPGGLPLQNFGDVLRETPPAFDSAEIRRALQLFFLPGDVFELRIPHAQLRGEQRPVTCSGYYDLDHIDALLSALPDLDFAPGIYVTTNPCQSGCLTRSRYRLRQIRSSDEVTSADRDILERRWIFVDVDAVRPKGISATPSEKAHAELVCSVIAADMRALGLPPGISNDSGNGAHLMLPCRLPNDNDSRDFHKAFLEGLAKYDTPFANVDRTTFNAARIIKLPGTFAAKGENDAESGRVWRVARITCDDRSSARGDELAIVPENLIAIAERMGFTWLQQSKVGTRSKQQSQIGRVGQREMMRQRTTTLLDFLTSHEIAHDGGRRVDGGTRFRLAVCPFDAGHCRDSAVFQGDDGMFGFKCFHAGCADKHWGDFPKLYERAGHQPQKDNGDQHKNRIRRRTAKNADARRYATQFLEALQCDEVSTLRFWEDSFWYWHQGAYRESKVSNVRAKMIQFLNLRLHHLQMAFTSNALDQVKASTLLELQNGSQPPCWLAPVEGAAGWDPAEILCTPSQLVHLPSIGTTRPHALPATPRFFSLAALDYEYDPTAPWPVRWTQFLEELWPDDVSSRLALQEWFGYCLAGDGRLQKILLLIGPKRCGKGTVGRVLRGVIGAANVAGPTLSGLASQFGLAGLIGKSVAIIGDAHMSSKTDQAVVVDRLLSISGQDTLTVDRKHRSAIDTILPTRILVMTNELPRFADSSGALAARNIILPMHVSFFGRENPDLTRQLLEERTGILNWSLMGW